MKCHLVHQRSHQENSATVRAQEVSSFGRIRDGIEVKAIPLISDREYHLSVPCKTTADMNSLIGILTIAVDHGIRQRFSDSYFDVNLTSILALSLIDVTPNTLHQLLYEG
jgi:hypothetical protein